MDTKKVTTELMNSLKDRLKGAIFGQFIGDSLAMPVHWYYDLYQLKKDFGKITKYESPKETFKGSIMNLSNTSGGGRGSDKGDLVGKVILHGKKKFWLRGGSYHYHHGMKAGENTLDTLITRVLYRSMIKMKKFDTSDFVNEFIKFMTTPDTHNDVYASSSLRMFFKNLSEGKPLNQCPDNDGHNVDTIDSLVIVPPLILSNLYSSHDILKQELTSAIQSTRNTTKVVLYSFIYSDMVFSLLNGKNMREVVQEAGLKIGYDVASKVKAYGEDDDPMTACYIDSSFPAMLYYAYKYSDDPEKMLLASANGGGENVARGALLGVLCGAHFGLSGFPKNLINDLVDYSSISSEADQFLETFLTEKKVDL